MSAVGGILLFLTFFLIIPAAAAEIKHPPIRNTAYQARLVGQSVPDGTVLVAGETKQVVFTFKNTGKATWLPAGSRVVSAYTINPGYHASQLAGKKWLKPSRPAIIGAKTAVGKTVKLTVAVTAPSKPGEYREDFYLAAEDDTWIKGSHFYIKIRVLAASTTDEAGFWDDVISPAPVLQAEPLVRVNLFNTTEAIKWQSDFEYQVLAGTSTLLTLPPSTMATMSYQDGEYRLSVPGAAVTSIHPLRLTPVQPNSYWSLLEYERVLAGRKGINFNTYRGTLIVAYSAKSSELMVVNELPLEQYVAGVTEASDGVPSEYAKALQVAARSYAWQKIPVADKPRPVFDMYASTVDQLYLGYNAEVKQPRIVAATIATAGQLVTYQGKPVITPYFSRSDGQTRAWSAAWGGTDKPWLVSVKAVHDEGFSRLGHGVGMSGHDALLRAGNDGWTYEQILGHYYSGTKLAKVY